MEKENDHFLLSTTNLGLWVVGNILFKTYQNQKRVFFSINKIFKCQISNVYWNSCWIFTQIIFNDKEDDYKECMQPGAFLGNSLQSTVTVSGEKKKLQRVALSEWLLNAAKVNVTPHPHPPLRHCRSQSWDTGNNVDIFDTARNIDEDISMTPHGRYEAPAHTAWMLCCVPLPCNIQQRYRNMKIFYSFFFPSLLNWPSDRLAHSYFLTKLLFKFTSFLNLIVQRFMDFVHTG